MSENKRKKNYAPNKGHFYKKRILSLQCGLEGFLCTCNFREKDCVKDAYNLLNEFSEKIFQQDKKEVNTENADNTKDNSGNVEKNEENEDIASALKSEVHSLKEEASVMSSQKKFQAVDTGVKNIVFIQSKVEDVLELGTSIIKEIDETKIQRTRYILRLLPIQITCKAYIDDIKSKAEVLFEKYFVQEPKTFSIVFNRHSNSNLERNEVIKELAAMIVKKNPENKVDLKNPNVAVVLEIIRGVCLISIAPDYFKYKKYNLIELSNSATAEESC